MVIQWRSVHQEHKQKILEVLSEQERIVHCSLTAKLY